MGSNPKPLMRSNVPSRYWKEPALIASCRVLAESSGGRLERDFRHASWIIILSGEDGSSSDPIAPFACDEWWTMNASDVRKGMPPVKQSRDEFERRYRRRFVDPVFRALGRELDAIVGLRAQAAAVTAS